MIKLSVPAIFDEGFLSIYKNFNAKYTERGIKIYGVYGSLPEITSARESERLPLIDKQQLFEYANKLRNIGIDFNYTLNSTTITYEQIDKFIAKFLKDLYKNGIRTITIASPLLMEYVHRKFPDFSIVVSTITHIDSLNRIKQVKSFGANRITLDIRANRNFKFLSTAKKLKNSLKGVEFEILVNEFCGDCSIRNIHYNLQSLNAIEYPSKDPFFVNYPFNVCTQLFLSDLKEILKNYWILPDWMKYYHERYGIDWMKITGRTIKNIGWHKFVLEEYMKQEYNGNIMDLGPLVLGGLEHEGGKSEIYLDAEALKRSGYIEYFMDKQPDCKSICGITCNFCDKLADVLKG